MSTPRALGMLLVLGTCGACGRIGMERTSMEDAGGMPGTDAGPPAPRVDAGWRHRDGAAPPVEDAGGPADDDGNTGFAEAVELTSDEEATGDLRDEGDRDYLRFEGVAGQWVAVVVSFDNPTYPGGAYRFVPAVGVYDEAMAPINLARDSNHCATDEASVGQERLVRLRSTGTYYVELGIAAGGDELADEGWTVTLVDPAETGFSVIEVEGDTPEIPSSSRGCVLGGFDDAGAADGLDGFRVIGPATIEVSPYSPARFGSTGTAEVLALRDGAGGLWARHEGVAGEAFLMTSVGPGTFTLELSAPADRGDDDHYIVRIRDLAEWVIHREAADATNGALGGAEVVVPGPSGGNGPESWVVTSVDSGDVDHFAIDVPEPSEGGTGQLQVQCVGEGGGSGTRGLEVDLLDPTGALAERAADVPAYDAHLDAPVDPPGRWTLRVTSTAPGDPALASRTVLCGIALDEE